MLRSRAFMFRLANRGRGAVVQMSTNVTRVQRDNPWPSKCDLSEKDEDGFRGAAVVRPAGGVPLDRRVNAVEPGEQQA